MLCFSPRFFIRQRKRCADVSSRIECIIDSRVILGGFYHASNSLAWVCECMGSIFIVFSSVLFTMQSTKPVSLNACHSLIFFYVSFSIEMSYKQSSLNARWTCLFFASFSSFYRVVLRAVWQALLKASQTFVFPQSLWFIKRIDGMITPEFCFNVHS